MCFPPLPGFPCCQDERLQQNQFFIHVHQVLHAYGLEPKSCSLVAVVRPSFSKWTECRRVSAFSFLWPFSFSLIVEPMENWLQLMLNWDPQQRGGGLDPETSRPKCFLIMDHILNLKVSEGCDWV